MKYSKPKRVSDELDAWGFAWNVDTEGVLSGEPAREHRNPIDEDLHADEPVVFGPDGSGEAMDRRQPYAGAD